MAEVTNELMYEILKQLQARMDSFDKKMDEIKSELQALRNHSLAMQQDVQNIYTILVRHDSRLDRIKQRLELREAPA
jgi:chromosome segregation ATPase